MSERSRKANSNNGKGQRKRTWVLEFRGWRDMRFWASNCSFVKVPKPAGSLSACLTRINKQAPRKGEVTWGASLCSRLEKLSLEHAAPCWWGKADSVGSGGVARDAVCILSSRSSC